MGKFEIVEGALLEAPYLFERNLSAFKCSYGLSFVGVHRGGNSTVVQNAKIAVSRELDVGKVFSRDKATV